MAKIKRRVVTMGSCYVVECAVREDGATSPAESFLRQLSQGAWAPDPDHTQVPDDSQVHDHLKLLVWLRLLAEEGRPPYRHAVNYLADGIWEFKIGAKRLSFYDTPGDGTYRPKARRTERVVFDDFWWFPYFDELVRLGHAFPKRSQHTPLADIREAVHVRQEDLAHDTAA